MKKYVSILLVLLLILCFTGCKDSTGDTTPTDNAPKTTIDPLTVNFDYNSGKSYIECWYLQNSDDVTYIYFTDDNAGAFENCICTYHLVESGVVTNSAPLCCSNDNHLVPALSSNTYVDFVFEDYFTVYDYASGNRYSRGNADEYNSYFKDKTYTSENEQCAIAFNNDFTLTKTDKKKVVTGTWEIVSTRNIACTVDDEILSYTIDYYDDLSVKSIKADNEVLYPEISENETINKYKAY